VAYAHVVWSLALDVALSDHTGDVWRAMDDVWEILGLEPVKFDDEGYPVPSTSSSARVSVARTTRDPLIRQVAMPLSWNEIRDRAVRFGHEWKDETRERAEAKSFWDGFFRVFGRERRVVASFEHPVKKLDKAAYGFIDLLWKGVLLVEHKSAGKDLAKAETQAFDYIQALIADGREHEVPRYIVVSDFARIALHDVIEDTSLIFDLADLHKHVHDFAFIAGYRTAHVDPPANIKAAEIMAALHDALEEGGYEGGDLDRLLTRILFCLFAEDTGIFEPNTFAAFIENRTAEDGSDLGPRLAQFFQTLNTPLEKRQKRLDEQLASLPFVNGELFETALSVAAFDAEMRGKLVDCAAFDWSAISPAIFGSIFQGVMESPERRQIGAHYTGEADIMKVLRGLFLDELETQLAAAKALKRGKEQRLKELHERIARLRFLDPACGCGNFLILAYRELRRIEQELLVAIHTNRLGHVVLTTDIAHLNKVSVEEFSGIEILDFPAEIARVGMWLMDHQMNVNLSEALGKYFVRLPLKGSAHILCGNALAVDWATLLAPEDDVFVLGNPPYAGKKEQNADQKADMKAVWDEVKGSGILDYVTAWYRRAAEYVQGTRIRCAFVSTNSIAQGEQVGVLWRDLFETWNLKIHFAHRTFGWTSEARGRAHVHVVIIGFGNFDVESKYIFDYAQPKAEPTVQKAKNVNPYLVEGGDTVVTSRRSPINGAPEIFYGSMMIDKPRKKDPEAGLVLLPGQRARLLEECPALKRYILRLYGGNEYLNGIERWCLWLVDAPPSLLRQSDLLKARIEGVRRFRKSSSRAQTRELAATPTLFGEIRQPDAEYLFIPKVSSESRRYLPMGFLPPEIIASGSALIVPEACLFQFGILHSAMHNAWMRSVCGRMKSDYQYSNNIVYNNFPWPEDVTEKATGAVEDAAQNVLDVREDYEAATPAELYDPVAMPAKLAKAHAKLDRAVDRCYRYKKFVNDRERVEHLFALYEKLTSG